MIRLIVLILLVGLSSNTYAFNLKKALKALEGDKNSDQAQSKGQILDIDAQIQSFIDQSNRTNKLVGLSLLSVERAYANGKERDELTLKMKALNEATDTKEINARVTEVHRSDYAKVIQLSQSQDIQNATASLNDANKKEITASIANLILAGFQTTQLIQQGKTIAGAVGRDPMLIFKVAPVAGSIPNLMSSLSSTTKIVGTYINVVKGANLDVPKVTAESQAVAINIDDFGGNTVTTAQAATESQSAQVGQTVNTTSENDALALCQNIAIEINKAFVKQIDNITAGKSVTCNNQNPLSIVYLFQANVVTNNEINKAVANSHSEQLKDWCSNSDKRQVLNLYNVEYKYIDKIGNPIASNIFNKAQCNSNNQSKRLIELKEAKMKELQSQQDIAIVPSVTAESKPEPFVDF